MRRAWGDCMMMDNKQQRREEETSEGRCCSVCVLCEGCVYSNGRCLHQTSSTGCRLAGRYLNSKP
jgi:hypothetical protein